MGIIKKKRQEAIDTASKIAAKGLTPNYSDDGSTFTLIVPNDPQAEQIRTDKLLGAGQSGLFHLKKKRATKAFELMAQQAMLDQAKARAAAEAERIAAENAKNKNKGNEGNCPKGTKPDGKGGCVATTPTKPKDDNPNKSTDDNTDKDKDKGKKDDNGTGQTAEVLPDYLSSDQVYDATTGLYNSLANGLVNFFNMDRDVSKGMLQDAVKSGKRYMEVNGQLIDVPETLSNLQAGQELEDAVVPATYGKMSLDAFVDRLNKFKSLADARHYGFGFGDVKPENKANPDFKYQILVGEGDDARLYTVNNKGQIVDKAGIKPYFIEEPDGLGSTSYIATLGGDNTQNRGEIIGPKTLGTAALIGAVAYFGKGKGKPIIKKIEKGVAKGLNKARRYGKAPAQRLAAKTVVKKVPKPKVPKAKISYKKMPDKPISPAKTLKGGKRRPARYAPRENIHANKPGVERTRIPGEKKSKTAWLAERREASNKALNKNVPSVKDSVKYWWRLNRKARNQLLRNSYKAPWTASKWMFNQAKAHPWIAAGTALGTGIAGSSFKHGGVLQRPTKKQFGGILFK